MRVRGLAVIQIYPSDTSSPNQPFQTIPLKTHTVGGKKFSKFANGYFIVLILLGPVSLLALHVLPL